MATVVMIAEYRLVPDSRESFMSVMLENATGTLKEIEGCLQFDVVAAENDPELAFAYEVFADDAAYRRYQDSGRVTRVREAYEDMVADRRIVRCLRD